jgi:hypothetical protein
MQSELNKFKLKARDFYSLPLLGLAAPGNSALALSLSLINNAGD